jgi:hypothetical protein
MKQTITIRLWNISLIKLVQVESDNMMSDATAHNLIENNSTHIIFGFATFLPTKACFYFTEQEY